jgi:prepilin-type N-terminal cleavage/methylation domain-containing protein
METKVNNIRGFTLVELAITITVISILSAICGGIIILGINNYLFISAHSLMTRESQNTMKLLHNEIEKAIPDQIISAQETMFSFINTDGNLIEFDYDMMSGVLRYRMDGLGIWQIVLNNIQSNGFSFSYYKNDGTAWSVFSEIRRVNINFNLTLAGENESYESEIFIRNK